MRNTLSDLVAGLGFGVYVHIPFCRHRCDYCAFATWTDRHHLQSAYLEAVGSELRRAVDDGLPPATSVFVGGGTPSLVDPARLGALIDSIPTSPDAEVTVECNPDDVTTDLLRQYRKAGVNRISLGVQSLVPHVLKGLGRTHDPAAVERAVEVVVDTGFPTWSVDLIYGGHGETADDWEATLAGALAVDPPHVSAYALTVEPGTPLALDLGRHPDDDDQADRYAAADEAFSAAGLEWYEVSNWARPGHESRHHLLYWAQGDYLGLGCAAHSHRDGRRWWNVRTPDRYIDEVTAGRSPEGAHEVLDHETRHREKLQLLLRTRAGVPATALDMADLPPSLVEQRGDRVVLTRAGRLLANEVAHRLL